MLAGFSFGAWVGLQVGCADERVRALLGVGLPANDSSFAYLADCPKPKLFVQGTRDEFGAREAVEAVVSQAATPKELVWVEGADHFFGAQLAALRQAILDRLPAVSGISLAGA